MKLIVSLLLTTCFGWLSHYFDEISISGELLFWFEFSRVLVVVVLIFTPLLFVTVLGLTVLTLTVTPFKSLFYLYRNCLLVTCYCYSAFSLGVFFMMLVDQWVAIPPFVLNTLSEGSALLAAMACFAHGFSKMYHDSWGEGYDTKLLNATCFFVQRGVLLLWLVSVVGIAIYDSVPK